MTKNVLIRLNDAQKNKLNSISLLINRYKKENLTLEYENNKGKMRGYLTCLYDLNIISDYEMKLLYLYYIDKNK